MNSELAIQKINLLPENIQEQVMDYIEFLVNKYINVSQPLVVKKQEIETITDETKSVLDDCLLDYKKNPKKVKPWEQVEQEIIDKYNYAL